MKRSPELIKLEQMLRSSKLVAGGFMGDDPRQVEDVIEADLAELEQLGYDRFQVARRMEQITRQCAPRFGFFTKINDKIEACVDESRGLIVCPWPHKADFTKTVTTIRRLDTGTELRWSNLNIHMIRAHGFFEGKGSPFRLEPKELIEAIF